MPTTSQTILKVKNFANLPDGWRFGEGVVIQDSKIALAVRLLHYANEKGLERSNAFALADGGLLVSFYIDKYTLDLTLEADGSLTIAEDFDDDQLRYFENLEVADAYDEICKFSEHIETVSELSTPTTTTVNLEGLRVRHSPLHPMAVSPYSTRIVRWKIVGQSASTFRNTIPNLQECHQSSGTFQ